MSRPTLHEIAAMPYSEGLKAMRAHYDPKWGMPLPDDDADTTMFRVKFDWTLEGSFDDEIEAETEAEAKELAKEYARDDAYSGRLRIDFMTVEKVGRA